MARNHYVPQFIIRKFSKAINVFNYSEGKLYENKKNDKVFFEKDIYSDEIEKRLADELEGPVGDLIFRKVDNKEDEIVFDRTELTLLKKYLLIASVRLPDSQGFVDMMRKFNKCVDKYSSLPISLSKLEKAMLKNNSILDWDLSDREKQMRVLEMYLDTNSLLELMVHRYCTKETYLWAKVVNDAYLAFWDSSENQEFILTDVGMVCEYEPGHAVFGGVDVSKQSYLLHHLLNTHDNKQQYHYGDLISSTVVMYENFNIFNLSSTRCMVLVHPFFRIYNGFMNMKCEDVIYGKVERVEFPVPDMWPTSFETKEIISQPVKHSYNENYLSFQDRFIYKPSKLSVMDTIYLNYISLSQTHNLMGYNDINKVVDSIFAANFLFVEDLHAKLQMIKSYTQDDLRSEMANSFLGKFINSLDISKLENKDSVAALFFHEHYASMVSKDTRENKYLLEYLLKNEDDLVNLPNFSCLGEGFERVHVIRELLEILNSGE